MLRRLFGQLPSFVQAPVLGIAKTVRTRGFQLPDAMDDIVRLSRCYAPAAILDIGAHMGQTARQLHRRLPQVPIHAFEPTPQNVEVLRQAVDGFSNVKVYAVAIADQVGSMRFFLNRNSQTNSLLDTDRDAQISLGEATAHTGTIHVPTTTLDAWMAQHLPAGDVVVKADVQGAELKLIAGAQRTLSSRVSVFYTEVPLAHLYVGQGNLFSIHEALVQNGPFSLYQIYRTRSNAAGQALWADAMWVRKDLIEP